jgi:hypothetical protein
MHTECVCVCTCWFRQRIIIKLGECKHVVNLKALIDRGILWYSHHELSSIPMKCDFFKSLLLHWSYNFLELRLQPHLLHLLSSTTLGIKWYWYTPYPYQPTVATDGPRWWWRKLREIDASLLYLVLQNQAFQHVTVFFATAPSSQLAPQPAPRVPNIPRRKIFRMRSHVFDELLTQAPPPPPTSQDLFNSWETAVPRTLGIQRIFFNAKSDPIPIPSLVQQHSEHGPRKWSGFCVFLLV